MLIRWPDGVYVRAVVCLAVICLLAQGQRPADGGQDDLCIAVYESAATAAQYHGVHQAPVRKWLERNRYDFQVIGDELVSQPAKLARFAAVVSSSNYVVPDAAADGLAAYVEAGGRLLWIDGPARCGSSKLLDVLGVAPGCTYVPSGSALFTIRDADHPVCWGLADFEAGRVGNPAVKATGHVLAESSAVRAASGISPRDKRDTYPAVVTTRTGRGVAVLLNWIIWLNNTPDVQTLMTNSLEYLVSGGLLEADECVIRVNQVPREIRQPGQVPLRLSVIARPIRAGQTVVLTARLVGAPGVTHGPTVEVRTLLKLVGNDMAYGRAQATIAVPDNEDCAGWLEVDGTVADAATAVRIKRQRVPLALTGRAHAARAVAQAARGRLLRPMFAGLHGDYDAEPRTKDGRVDIERLFQQIEAAHLDMYDFLIWHAPTDWDDFQVFLAQAHRRRLKVWVTLVPPSEPPPSAPFGLDYVRWADEIGRLSKRYDNLIAWVIDDFWSSENHALFTPEYLARVVETLHSHNPQVAFLPTLYWNTIGDDDFLDAYGTLLDGIVFPYADLESTAALADQLAACRKWLGPDKLLLINIYASGSSGTREPGPRTPNYLREILAISRQACDGIRLYCLPKQNYDDPRFRVVAEVFGKWSGGKDQRDH